ncbi:hypothetical protein JCGZ_03960 [Jatropha curcas]|uniref:Aminotransferase-like plant mobile domain-containing protein n=1 Tax=Jatropha curcas TaxID=180498 RepID=A0A067JCZ9_JATCU|nr:hypothetical protein JCGZ_03960 [Jatropha curcas]
MTLTPVDYAVITGLRFTGPAPPLDARYQMATLGAQLVCSLLGVTSQTRYTVQGCMSYEMVFRFWAERIRTRLEAWRELPEEARPAAPAYTREERDQAARERVFDTPVALSQRRIPHAPPRHMCLLEGLTREDLEVPAQRYQEICQRFGFARSYIGWLCSEWHELELENGGLRRHQSRQSSAVSRLQAEVERLRRKLEVEGIPLDSSDEDEDGSSDEVPLSPSPSVAAGPSRRRQ